MSNQAKIDNLFNEVETCINLFQWNRASEKVKKILEINPFHVEAISRSALINYELKFKTFSRKKSNELFIEAYKKKKDSLVVLNGLIYMLLKNGLLDKALKICNKVLKIDSKNLEALNYKGIILLGKNQLDKSYEIFQNALKIDPNYTRSSIYLARYYMKNRQYENAINLYEKILDKVTSNEKIYLSLGKLYKKKGNYDKAIFYYEKALDINPYNSETVKKLDKLNKKKNPEKSIARKISAFILYCLIAFFTGLLVEGILQISFFISIDSLILFFIYFLKYFNKKLKHIKIQQRRILLLISSPFYLWFPLIILISRFDTFSIEFSKGFNMIFPKISLLSFLISILLLSILLIICGISFISYKRYINKNYHKLVDKEILAIYHSKLLNLLNNLITDSNSKNNEIDIINLTDFIIIKKDLNSRFINVLQIYILYALTLLFIEVIFNIYSIEPISFLDFFQPKRATYWGPPQYRPTYWFEDLQKLIIFRAIYLSIYIVLIGLIYSLFESQLYGKSDFFNEIQNLINKKNIKYELIVIISLCCFFFNLFIGIIYFSGYLYRMKYSFFSYLGISEHLIWTFAGVFLFYLFICSNIILIRKFNNSSLSSQPIKIYKYEPLIIGLSCFIPFWFEFIPLFLNISWLFFEVFYVYTTIGLILLSYLYYKSMRKNDFKLFNPEKIRKYCFGMLLFLLLYFWGILILFSIPLSSTFYISFIIILIPISFAIAIYFLLKICEPFVSLNFEKSFKLSEKILAKIKNFYNHKKEL
ncbi:MAG: tetratricopeptide repeat protein [Promethearchaeota archaeon]